MIKVLCFILSGILLLVAGTLFAIMLEGNSTPGGDL